MVLLHCLTKIRPNALILFSLHLKGKFLNEDLENTAIREAFEKPLPTKMTERSLQTFL